MTNFENANGQLLQLSPRQSGSDRRLIEVLVHFLIVMKCLPDNPLLQPLTNLALNPALMMVSRFLCCVCVFLFIFLYLYFFCTVKIMGKMSVLILVLLTNFLFSHLYFA